MIRIFIEKRKEWKTRFVYSFSSDYLVFRSKLKFLFTIEFLRVHIRSVIRSFLWFKTKSRSLAYEYSHARARAHTHTHTHTRSKRRNGLFKNSLALFDKFDLVLYFRPLNLKRQINFSEKWKNLLTLSDEWTKVWRSNTTDMCIHRASERTRARPLSSLINIYLVLLLRVLR